LLENFIIRALSSKLNLQGHQMNLEERTMKVTYIKRSVIENLLSYARGLHPKESILLLRGKVSKDRVFINDTVIPPFATHGTDFSTFPLHMLPIDFSIVGVAHSHPSSVLAPSTNDLNQFYGRIMVIVAFPYHSERSIAVFDREGKALKFKVIE
jgi:proteasome lid subunit RPN8/RPN11